MKIQSGISNESPIVLPSVGSMTLSQCSGRINLKTLQVLLRPHRSLFSFHSPPVNGITPNVFLKENNPEIWIHVGETLGGRCSKRPPSQRTKFQAGHNRHTLTEDRAPKMHLSLPLRLCDDTKSEDHCFASSVQATR